jgi:hypothetical protein
LDSALEGVSPGREKTAPRDLFLNPERPSANEEAPAGDDQDFNGWQDPADQRFNNFQDDELPAMDDEREIPVRGEVAISENIAPVGAIAPSNVAPPQTAAVTSHVEPARPVERMASGPGYETQLRPELFTPPKAPKTTRRGSKAVRQRAERPDPLMFDIPLDGGPVAEVEPALRERLTSAALLARPVFTSDLVAIAGTPDIVSTWEGDLRSDPANSPVRFLAAKGRHRLRGSLVVPVNREPVDKGGRPNWWADCVERYRGSRLYELGVLLHRVGEEVISAEFDEHAALLRLNSARGIVGVLVVFDAITDDTNEVAFDRMLTQLLGERCSLIAVLTTAGEATAMTSLGETIGKMAVARGWRPSVPVITARSWEFADDRGSTAQLILGG